MGDHYDINTFLPWTWGKEGWEEAIPEKFKKRNSIDIFEVKDIPIKVLNLVGMKSYLSYLVKKIRFIRKDLEDRHSKKSKLLSDSLKKTHLLKSTN